MPWNGPGDNNVDESRERACELYFEGPEKETEGEDPEYSTKPNHPSRPPISRPPSPSAIQPYSDDTNSNTYQDVYHPSCLSAPAFPSGVYSQNDYSNPIGLSISTPNHATINNYSNGLAHPLYNQIPIQHGFPQPPVPTYPVYQQQHQVQPASLQDLSTSYSELLTIPHNNMPVAPTMDFSDDLSALLASFTEHNRSSDELRFEDLVNDGVFSTDASEAAIDAAKTAHLLSFAQTHTSTVFSTEPDLSPSSPLSSGSTTYVDAYGFPPLRSVEELETSSAINPAQLFTTAQTSAAAKADDPFDPELSAVLDALLLNFTPEAQPHAELTAATPASVLPPALPELASTAGSRSVTPSVRPTKPLPKQKEKAPPKVRELLPLDAPVQSRSYIAPSKTSRKVLPQAFVNRLSEEKLAGVKRALAGDDVVDEEAEELARFVRPKIMTKREQNTMAARRSRQRKMEEKADLEAERDGFKRRVEELERLLRESEAENKALRECLHK
ncbi:hypothetical protein CALVIDRAFT_529957 [Calocera viscosa TUFC12733]|uniref:BZIP domain-containing protein n=1 Tax=Calocera viscosa (strain TUFC12733) TaxID=1330018 RepID=A0A167IGU2_CALVF|nr:hypothetical protein CALVIDRAFT_529957 [Calocera viscosa TUFC12733]